MFKKTSWTRLRDTLSPAIVLVLLIWITPTTAEPNSYNDPFRAIALQAPKPPQPPICCLKPLPSLEPVEDDLLLSFEEWKAKQQANVSSQTPSTGSSSKDGNRTGNDDEPAKVEDETSSPPVIQEDQQQYTPVNVQEQPLQIPPHFRVPLVDRFNYASLECSARVHKTHKGAKHPSNILSSKKDRYMLSPCKTNGDKQFVIIELCDDIRIDTVQLANFEFFSGVFKDFTVKVAKTSWKDESEEGWTVAGNYKAKNVRGVQSFHPPTSLHGFYRYLRIDFQSHYGSEYYCPVSLVRVYGLTHLEEWKWELWEAESKAKMEAALKDAQIHRTTKSLDGSLAEETSQVTGVSQSTDEEISMPSPTILLLNETGSDSTPSMTMTTDPSQYLTDTHLPSPPTMTQTLEPELSLSSSPVTLAPVSVTSPQNTASSLPRPSTEPDINAKTPHLTIQDETDAAVTSTSIAKGRVRTRIPSSSIVVTASPIITAHPFLPIPVSGGESIYRMIMNRLVGLEQNHTLYGQYMAQQQHIVREALKRLGEDIGRLEGLGKAQRQVHDRTILEWEKQRKQWQMEHAQLLQTIDYLSDEIIMEKRLGVAQLCLLLAVLVFMGLTRGSRGPVFDDRRPWRPSIKSFSGEWRQPRPRKPEDPRTLMTDNQPIELPNGVTSVPLIVADSGSSSSAVDTDATPTAPIRLPLTNLNLNISGNQHQPISKDESHPPDLGRGISFAWNIPRTPTRIRSRTTSRSRIQTSSWQGKGPQFQPNGPGLRQIPYASSTGGLISTPSKGARVIGTHSPKPVIASMRSAPYITNPKRTIPLQRSHSSYGPGSTDYLLGQTWTGSGNALKSARRWARTAHLHQVKNKSTEDHDIMSGGSDLGAGADDIFGSGMKPRVRGDDQRDQRVILSSEDPGVDNDGWESASDVEFDSIEGI